jgi:hypothetical protein
MARRKKAAGVREPALAAYRYRSARRGFDSDTAMADVLGVHRSNITRWKHGETSPENAELLVALDVVVTLLTGFLEPESIPDWLRGFNAHLGNRQPIEVLRQGHLAQVIAAIEREKQGAFA